MNAETARNFHCPRWEELPSLPLYMDQVVMVLTEAVGPFAEGEKGITSTMVNNYVKQKVIAAPEKKRYGRRQMGSLIVVFVMKRVFSISEIFGLKEVMKAQLGREQAYDIFCEMLEKAVKSTFADGNAPALEKYDDGPLGALDAAMASLMGKMYLQDVLAKMTANPPAQDDAPPAAGPATQSPAAKAKPKPKQK